MENKKIAIMQPYFFPYLGYFQLISAVDIYVNLDHISFMKRSYMTRNKLKNETSLFVQVVKGSQNEICSSIKINFEHNYLRKTLRTLESLYSKSKNYQQIMEEIILPEFFDREISISSFNLKIIKRICKFLEIKTKIIDSSAPLAGEAKFEQGLIGITKQLKANTYINSIGGQNLYQKSDFKKEGIDLMFQKMNDVELDQPYLSILHQLFTYPREHLIKQLSKYELF